LRDEIRPPASFAGLFCAGALAAPPKKGPPGRPRAGGPCRAGPAAAPAAEDKGREINGVCAACHGEFGQGGKRGEYPRLAGQRAAYLKDQLKSFRARKRINLPMYPYTQERELPDEDIEAVSDFSPPSSCRPSGRSSRTATTP
jgi:cytochrome c553